MLINKRPVAYKQCLIDPKDDPSLGVITPELLLKGYDVPSLSMIPQLNLDLKDPDYVSNLNPSKAMLFESFENLRKSKSELNKLYYSEFIERLRDQSTSDAGRYKHKSHTPLAVGDLVMIRQDMIKPYFQPMGVVVKVEINGLGETVSATVRKANNIVVRRHVTDLVLLERSAIDPLQGVVAVPKTVTTKKCKRAAAQKCTAKLKELVAADLL
jgi:hypothetical protein